MIEKPTLAKSPVVFNEEEHRYFLGDKELKGITSSLIHRAFPDKYKDIDPEVLANAAQKGKALHSAIEFYDNFGGNPEEAEDDRVKLYANMKERYGLVTIANEYLVSDEQDYASSIDIVALSPIGIFLIDIKTTWTLDTQSTGLQLSIYRRLFERQNPGLKVAGIYALWLPNKDHTICEFKDLAVVDDETIDALIEADRNDEPFQFQLIPDEWRDLERQYDCWLSQAKAAEENMTLVKKQMMAIMETTNITSVRTDLFTVSYIAAKKSSRFDSTLFRKENADLYRKYQKEAESPAQLRITPKTNNEKD